MFLKGGPMKKVFWILLALALVASCGKGTEDEAETAEGTEVSGGQGTVDELPPPRPAIDDEPLTRYEKLVAGYIRPYFDQAGTETSRKLASGELFELYVVAEFNDAYLMAAAEYRLVLPKGITVLAQAHTDSMTITVGKHDVDFSMTFHCIPGPKHWLVKYFCKVEDDFAGGVVETAAGDQRKFIGFVTCADQLQVRALGGTAEALTK
jgi:hypothetical protein